jgi:hypothetical protein
MKIEDEVLDLVDREFHEIGDIVIEDGFIAFQVYRGDYEEAPRVIKTPLVKLTLMRKFDDPYFRLLYRFRRIKNRAKETPTTRKNFSQVSKNSTKETEPVFL